MPWSLRNWMPGWFSAARPPGRGSGDLLHRAAILSRHLDNILTFCRLRITNGTAEGLNLAVDHWRAVRKSRNDRKLFLM